MQGSLFAAESLESGASELPPVERSDTGVDLGPFSANDVHYVDCIAAMQRMPDACVDLAIADPPYNLSKGGQWRWDSSMGLPGFGGDWNKVMASWDDLPLSEYVAFTLSWLKELKRIVRPSGSIWVHGTYHNAGIINFCLQALQIEIINEVIWYKRNSFPNISGRRLTASHETILWAHTGRKRQYRFNYDAAKGMICPEDGLKEPGKQLRTVWDIPNNKKRDELSFGKHPTQKPLRLLERMLQISAFPGCAVLVPFAGAGSECLAARRFGARFVGFETDAEYVQVCRRRLGLLSKHSRRMANKHATLQEHNERTKAIPSLLKWTGSKRGQANKIAEVMPHYSRYIEPFVGGGGLLYVAAKGNALAGDIYEPLIAFWKLVQNEPDDLVADYREKWKRLQKELRALGGKVLSKRRELPKYYYEVRRQFNATRSPFDLNFLMRTCVNGIVRFNDRGEFNNSFHLTRGGMTPDRFEAVVSAWRPVVKHVAFVCQDYEATTEEAKRGDFVYLDPPYAGNRQRYIANLDLSRLFGVLDRLNSRGVSWALSFDGRRGDVDLTHEVPAELYKRQIYLPNGNSAVHKVLNGPIEIVHESLYLNY